MNQSGHGIIPPSSRNFKRAHRIIPHPDRDAATEPRSQFSEVEDEDARGYNLRPGDHAFESWAKLALREPFHPDRFARGADRPRLPASHGPCPSIGPPRSLPPRRAKRTQPPRALRRRPRRETNAIRGAGAPAGGGTAPCETNPKSGRSPDSVEIWGMGESRQRASLRRAPAVTKRTQPPGCGDETNPKSGRAGCETKPTPQGGRGEPRGRPPVGRRGVMPEARGRRDRVEGASEWDSVEGLDKLSRSNRPRDP